MDVSDALIEFVSRDVVATPRIAQVFAVQLQDIFEIFFDFMVQRSIPMVFHVVVGSTGERLCNFGPHVAIFHVLLDNQTIFFKGPQF